MRWAAAALALMPMPAAVLAGTASHCGWAEDMCDCAAIFAVLESADGDQAFEARLRVRSQELREGVNAYHGQSAGDAAIDARIEALKAQGSEVQDAIDLAQVLARCEPFLTGVADRSLVLVGP